LLLEVTLPAAIPAAPATTSALPPSTLAALGVGLAVDSPRFGEFQLYVQNEIEKGEEEIKKLEKELAQHKELDNNKKSTATSSLTIERNRRRQLA
jgi:hypothetical protein